MVVPLSVRIGEDEHVTRLLDDLAPREGLHGSAECGFNLARPLSAGFDAFERVHVFDTRTGDTVWEGSLEDPGRTVSGDGVRWDASAVGDVARAADRAFAYVLIDTDPARFEREHVEWSPSGTAEVAEVPDLSDVDGLRLQFNPGQPIDASSAIQMKYRAMRDAGMDIGGITYTEVSGYNGASNETHLRALPSAILLRSNPFSTTPEDRWATPSDATPVPAGTTTLALSNSHIGPATTVGTETNWCAFYGITVRALRLHVDGSTETSISAYRRGVYPHEIVADILARLLTDAFEATDADIDTSSTYEVDQFAYPDAATSEHLLDDVMALVPEFTWQLGFTNPATGKPGFSWRRWPTTVRYEASMAHGLTLPGADAERYNRVTVRWADKKGRPQTTVRVADGVQNPVVEALETAGPDGTRLWREPEPQDLGDEVGSENAAIQFGDRFLAEHANPPVSGTLTVAGKVYDTEQGRHVDPFEVQTGHLVRVRELVDGPDDLFEDGPDGKCVFRIVGRPYQASDNAAQLELDAPPRNDTNELAKQINQRIRKR